MRNRGPRERNRLSGSFASFSGVTAADCRYAADVTMSLKNFLMSQPLSRNSTASQSSSSGWLGGSPVTPKSPVVRTIPVPNTCCQNRLTVTRAVSGFSGRSSHSASPSRLCGISGVIGGSAFGVSAPTLSRRLSYSPR